MIEVTLLENYLGNKKGDKVVLDYNIAHGLLERGVAMHIKKPTHENRMVGGANKRSKPVTK